MPTVSKLVLEAFNSRRMLVKARFLVADACCCLVLHCSLAGFSAWLAFDLSIRSYEDRCVESLHELSPCVNMEELLVCSSSLYILWQGCWCLGTHGRSFPPVTISPSLRVVYMVKTGPLCAFATTRTRKCSLHTNTSPFIAPVNVRLF